MNIKQDSIILRNHNNMRNAILSNNGAEYSIHNYQNFFLEIQVISLIVLIYNLLLFTVINIYLLFYLV